MKTELSTVERSEYGNMELYIEEMYFIEVKKQSKKNGLQIVSTWYGPKLRKEIDKKHLKHTSSLIWFLKSKGYKKLKAKKIVVGE